jgi:hypothetical protein
MSMNSGTMSLLSIGWRDPTPIGPFRNGLSMRAASDRDYYEPK